MYLRGQFVCLCVGETKRETRRMGEEGNCEKEGERVKKTVCEVGSRGHD